MTDRNSRNDPSYGLTPFLKGRRILKWSGLSIKRKAQLVGAFAGGFLTVALLLIVSIHQHNGAGDSASDYIDATGVLGMLLTWPSLQLCRALGLELRPDQTGSVLVLYIVAVFCNGLASAFLGTIAAMLVSRTKNTKTH